MEEFNFKEIEGAIEKATKGAPYLFITLANDGHSYSVKVGKTESIAEAMFTSIVTNGHKGGVATDLYRAIKDVMLNLFETDDKYRTDFITEMMNFSAAMSIKNKMDKKK